MAMPLILHTTAVEEATSNAREPLHLHLEVSLVDMASSELEKMRLDRENGEGHFHSFPGACLSLLKTLDGNHRCVDCGDHDPQWATVSYGAMVCLNCSGRHRSLGVHNSCVRSVTMDNWSHNEVLSMLEGGNGQLKDFFGRHRLCEEAFAMDDNGKAINKNNVTQMRYKTKAALFYRQQLSAHITKVHKSGAYRGRRASRTRRNSFVME